MNIRMWFRLFVVLAIVAGCASLSHFVNVPAINASNGATMLWQQKLPDLASSPLVLGKNGWIYVATRSGPVYALDRSGATQWSYRPDLAEPSSALMLDKDGNLYFSTLAKIFSLTADGQKRWESACSGNVFRPTEHAALGDGVIYTSCGENFVALNTADGQELWRFPIQNGNVKPVVLKDGTVIAPHGWTMSAFDPTGNATWNFPPPDYVAPAPRKGLISDQQLFDYPVAVGKDETFYLGCGDGMFCAFSPDGTEKWSYDAGPLMGIWFSGSPVIASDDTVIAVSNQGIAYAFTPDGKLRWKVRLGDPIKSIDQPSPVVGKDGMIYTFCYRYLVALTLEGKMAWDVRLSDDTVVPPALAPDGTLYVATIDGVLTAYKTGSKGLAHTSWPKYQGDPSNSGRF